MRVFAWPIATVIALATPQASVADPSASAAPNRALIMWSSFSCSTYAGLYGNKAEEARLFEIGYSAGKAFVEGARNKSIPESEVKNAPVGVLWNIAGPTTEFVIGRIFEVSADDAYDKVVKRDSSGALIADPSKWADDQLKIIRAENMFQQSNCSLIR